MSADFDEEDHSFLLAIGIAKPGYENYAPQKPKPKVQPPSPKPPPEPAKPPAKPSLSLKDLAKVSMVKPPVKTTTKPKEMVEKEEKLKKRDPFFETEEYEVR